MCNFPSFASILIGWASRESAKGDTAKPNHNRGPYDTTCTEGEVVGERINDGKGKYQYHPTDGNSDRATEAELCKFDGELPTLQLKLLFSELEFS